MIPNKKIDDEERGLRKTLQRMTILEELKKVKTHPTAEEVFKAVKKRLPNVSLATVHRNLDDLAGVGLILRLKVGGELKRFDATVGEHYHVRCLKCGRVADLPFKPFMVIRKEVKNIKGFCVSGHSLEYYGTCARCMGNRKHMQ